MDRTRRSDLSAELLGSLGQTVDEGLPSSVEVDDTIAHRSLHLIALAPSNTWVSAL